jgi:isoleucyl-tRNA synthetase
VVEAYLKLRNTLRILAANLYDFDPTRDAVPRDRMQELDRFAVARYGDAAGRILRAYEAYDYPAVFQVLNALVTVDLSAFYVDVSKDRLYTLAPASPARRSAQTALFTIVDGLARLIAPVLPVTADELWQHLPGTRDASVHLASFPDVAALADGELLARWERLLAVREAVNVEIEKLRKAKVVGKSLEAAVELRAGGPLLDLLRSHLDDLPTLFIVSGVELHGAGGEGEADPAALTVTVTRAGGVRCDRCWRYVPAVSAEAGREGLCERCDQALSEAAR